MTLGQNIARLRTQKNLSQGDLADALEVSRQSVSKWETDASIPELDKLLRLAELFGVTLDELEVSEEEIDAALATVDEEFLRSIEYAADNIADFHQRQLQQSWFTTRDDGAITGQRFTALERAGIYVPGGRAQYPSTVLMNAIPASVAGVDEIIMCTPPSKDGTVNPYTLAAASVAGVDRIFDMGRTTVNITGDAACTIIVSRLEEKREAKKLSKN